MMNYLDFFHAFYFTPSYKTFILKNLRTFQPSNCTYKLTFDMVSNIFPRNNMGVAGT